MINSLRDSFRNENNQAGLIVFHGTIRDIDGFLPLSHFGSYRAAMERLTSRNGTICIPTGRNREEFCPERARIYQVRLSIFNPIEIPDLGIQHSVRHFVDLLIDRYSDVESLQLLKDKQVTEPMLISCLKGLGYDGFIYTNHSEDKGSKAHVILDSSQAIIENVFDYSMITKNLQLYGEAFSPFKP
jgi:hypothetical protein